MSSARPAAAGTCGVRARNSTMSRSAIGWVRFFAPGRHRQHAQALDEAHEQPERRRSGADHDRGAQAGRARAHGRSGSARPRGARPGGARASRSRAPSRRGRRSARRRPPRPPRRRRGRRAGRVRRSPRPASLHGVDEVVRGRAAVERGLEAGAGEHVALGSLDPGRRVEARGVTGERAHGPPFAGQSLDEASAHVSGRPGHELHQAILAETTQRAGVPGNAAGENLRICGNRPARFGRR